MARERRRSVSDQAAPEQAEVAQEGRTALKSRIEQAREVYESLIAKPVDIEIGGRKFLIYPKSWLHLTLIVEKLVQSADLFESAAKVFSEALSGENRDVTVSVKLGKEILNNFNKLFDLLASAFAIVLCQSPRPTGEELQEIEEHLKVHLNIPLAMFILTCTLEQNSLANFTNLLRGATKEMQG